MENGWKTSHLNGTGGLRARVTRSTEETRGAQQEPPYRRPGGYMYLPLCTHTSALIYVLVE